MHINFSMVIQMKAFKQYFPVVLYVPFKESIAEKKNKKLIPYLKKVSVKVQWYLRVKAANFNTVSHYTAPDFDRSSIRTERLIFYNLVVGEKWY